MQPPPGHKLSQRKKPSARASHTVTSQAEANARAREGVTPFDDAESLTRTLSTTSMSEIEMESTETESTPAKVHRKSDVYVKINVKDEHRIKDCIRGKDRMQRWYVHRAFLRMSMEYEVEALEADTRAINDLEDRLTTLRDTAAENRNLTTRVATENDARELELDQLRTQLATANINNITLTNRLTAAQAENEELRTAVTTTPLVPTEGADTRALMDEIRQLTVMRDSYKLRVVELSSRGSSSQDRAHNQTDRDTVSHQADS